MIRTSVICLCMVLALGCGKKSKNKGGSTAKDQSSGGSSQASNNSPAANSNSPAAGNAVSLKEARKSFTTTLRRQQRTNEPVPNPPSDLFQKVEYTAPAGNMAAYLSVPRDPQTKSPAIVWITGGDCNSIGDVWEENPRENDQSASAFRKAGIVMMFPSLRGGNQNPGVQEGFYGEVDDIIAATDYLARQPFVDPKRIYLGGHSTGGTMVLLVAACSDKYRAVFSFGPVDELDGYPDQFLPFNVKNSREMELRAPIKWLKDIKNPTFVFEGQTGNISSLVAMSKSSRGTQVKLFPIMGGDHFSILAPLNELLAKKVLADTGPQCNISFLATEFAEAMKK